MIAQGLIFCCQRSRWNSNGVTPNGGTKCSWGSLGLFIVSRGMVGSSR